MEKSHVAEYAKTGESRCRNCSNLIEYEVLRLGVEEQASKFDGTIVQWYHKNCFFEKNNPVSNASIKKVQNLRYIDQDFIKDKTMKRNHSNDVELNDSLMKKSKTEINLEQKRKLQNEDIYKFRDALKKNNYSWNDLLPFLDENDQHRPTGLPDTLFFIAEILTCGALKNCDKCKVGKLYYDEYRSGYECKRLDFWSRSSCDKKKNPDRKNWEVPELCSKDFSDFLNSIEKRLEDRIFLEISEFKEYLNNNCLPEQVEKITSFNKEKQKLVLDLQSGTQVDPESKLDQSTHIFQHNGYIYNTTLIKSDIQNNKNSYYKIQLLEDDNKSAYWVFRSWGRIGTEYGGNKIDKFNTSSKAVEEFENLYLTKTGNEWTDPSICKEPGKYVPVEIDYGTKEIAKEIIEPSKLEVPVQEFLELITNIDFMEPILIEMEIDIQKMPLGKISLTQIKFAAECLAKIENLNSEGETDERKYIEESNKFYTFVPHNVGALTIIRTKNQVSEKYNMLTELREIKINYQIINIEQIDLRKPIDVFYENIKTEIKTISSDAEDFKMIKKYIENTHGSTHNFPLKIDKIFEINRAGEDQRYEPFKNFDNKKLLWHGSRLTNFAGILTNGLKIAPAESHLSGSMFGNGVYFTDVVSKSALYCNTDSNGVGALLLCEVALGEFEEFDHSPDSSCITDLILQNKSCKGLGKNIPNPEESEFQDGVEIPLGRLMRVDNYSGKLDYNEYIVYNVDKIKCKYLVLLNFD